MTIVRSTRRVVLAAAASAFFGAFATTQALAQTAAAPKWPTQPVRFVVPFPAGSAPDVMVRVLGAKLQEKWGQAVVVDNRPGGSGVIGMANVMSSPTDGYTLAFAQGSALFVAPHTMKKVPYEFDRDFVPIGLVAVSPMLLLVPGDSPYKTVDEFIAAGRAGTNAIEIADNGPATLPHLTAALLGLNGKAQFLHVHYQGGAQAMQGTLSGQTKAQVEPLVTVAGVVQSGRMKVLGSFGDKPEPGLENYPLVSAAAPGTVAHGWYAIVGRKGLDPAIVRKVNADLNDALATPEVVNKYRELAAYPRPGTPADLSKFLEQDSRKWQTVLERIDFKPE